MICLCGLAYPLLRIGLFVCCVWNSFKINFCEVRRAITGKISFSFFLIPPWIFFICGAGKQKRNRERERDRERQRETERDRQRENSSQNVLVKLNTLCPNTGKYGPEITPYLDNFHAMIDQWKETS